MPTSYGALRGARERVRQTTKTPRAARPGEAGFAFVGPSGLNPDGAFLAPCHGAPPASSPPRRPSGPFSIRAGQDASTRRRRGARPCTVNVRGCRRVPRRASRVDRASTWCFAARGRLPPSSTAPETQRAYARATSGLCGGSGPILDGAKAAQKACLRCKARTYAALAARLSRSTRPWAALGPAAPWPGLAGASRPSCCSC